MAKGPNQIDADVIIGILDCIFVLGKTLERRGMIAFPDVITMLSNQLENLDCLRESPARKLAAESLLEAFRMEEEAKSSDTATTTNATIN